MKTRINAILGIFLGCLAVFGWILLGAGSPSAQETQEAQGVEEVQRGPLVIYESYHDESQAVREYPTHVAEPRAPRILPEARRRGTGLPPLSFEPDAVLQDLGTNPVPLVSATIGLNFDGMRVGENPFLLAPPDTNAAVGATQVVETVNIIYQVFSKSTGASVFGPAEIGTLFTGMGGNCGMQIRAGNYSDPVVIYDQAAGRWVISIIAFSGTFAQNDECFAVSSTSDATGKYHRYDFSFGSAFPDYQKIAAWPDAYYAAFNIFNPGFAGAEACAFNRAAMLAGTTATAHCFPPRIKDFSFLPSGLDGVTPPPSGRPNFYLELSTTSPTQLNLFKFHVDFTTPSNTKFTGPTTITVPAYTQPCVTLLNPRACVPQPLPGEKLDALGDRLMHRLAYRNFVVNGVNHEVLVASHTVVAATGIEGVRWYEIHNPLTPTLFQSGTIMGANGMDFWMPSIAMDKMHDIAVGFSGSSTSVKPEILFTGRVPTDPLGMMESVRVIKAGAGVQKSTGHRWGDYSSMAIDPSDDCTFWYANEYIPSNGSFNWNTRLASFKFPACP